MGFILGIDLGGTNTKLGLVGEEGVICLDSLPSLVEQGPQAWLERLEAKAREFIAASGLDPAGLQGIGIDSPGGLDLDRGSVTFAPNLKTFNGFELRDQVAGALGLPAILQNDANAYAFGEYRFGAGGGLRDLVCLTLGTGVGGGIILDGEIVTGPLKIGGELGHIMVEPQGRFCGCGARGCVESYASATGFRGSLKEAIAAGRVTSLGPDDDVLQMSQAARSGDDLAQELFDLAGVALARATAMLCVTVGIGLFVIGAGISRSFDLMRPSFELELKRRLHMIDPGLVRVEISRLGNQAAILGAAAWAAHRLGLAWKEPGTSSGPHGQEIAEQI